MLKVLEDIREKFDKGEITILVLLDFSKAFDSLDFNILLIKLEKYFGFDTFAIELMRSYITNRCQRVYVDGKKSDLGDIKSGVPQGSILGPILFCIYINDIVHCCKNAAIHLYADDAQVYLSRPLGLCEDLVCRLNEDLARISLWAKNNGLKLNASKSQALPIMHTPHNVDFLSPISLNEAEIVYERTALSLGFKINSKLSCWDHVNLIVCKMYGVIRKLWASSSFLSVETKLKLIKSLLIPVISYSGLVYGKLDSASKSKLQLAINNAARYVFMKRKYDHISIYARQILSHDITNHYNILNLIFLHKLIYTKCPQYLFEKLRFANSVRTLNIITPAFNYLASSRLFFVNAIKLWNLLPTNIKSIRNPESFKLAVNSFFS